MATLRTYLLITLAAGILIVATAIHLHRQAEAERLAKRAAWLEEIDAEALAFCKDYPFIKSGPCKSINN